MSNWYLFRNGQTYGPYTEERISDWIRTGQIRVGEKLAREGGRDWLTPDKIPEFEDDFWAAPETPASAPVAPPLPVLTPSPPRQTYMNLSQQQMPTYGVQPALAPYKVTPGERKDKLIAGLLALLVGGIGAHHFYLGNTRLAIAYLLASLSGLVFSLILIGMLWAWIPGVLSFIEGIIYLTISEERFQRNYHHWFCSGP